jgi:exonuclease III
MALVASYNMHGYTNGEDLLRELCASHAVICVQEHWLKYDDLTNLSCVATSHLAISHTSMLDIGVHYGRPYGGLSLLHNKQMVKRVVDRGISINSRVMACSLIMNNNEQFLNVYLPCWRADLHEVDIGIICGFMQNVINVNSTAGQHIIIAGDFNVSPNCVVTESALLNLRKLIVDCGLISCASASVHNGQCTHTFRCLSRNFCTRLNDIYMPQPWASAGLSVNNNNNNYLFI